MTTVNTQNVALALKNYVENDPTVNVSEIDFEVKVDDKNRLRVSSNDFAEQTSPRMYKEVRFVDFGSYYDEEKDTWSIDLSYRVKTFVMGGENGTDYVSFEFNSDGQVLASVDSRKLND